MLCFVFIVLLSFAVCCVCDYILFLVVVTVVSDISWVSSMFCVCLQRSFVDFVLVWLLLNARSNTLIPSLYLLSLILIVISWLYDLLCLDYLNAILCILSCAVFYT